MITLNFAGRTIEITNLNNASLIFDKSMTKLGKNDEASVLIIDTRSSKYDDDIFLFAHSLNKFRLANFMENLKTAINLH